MTDCSFKVIEQLKEQIKVLKGKLDEKDEAISQKDEIIKNKNYWNISIFS